MNRLTLAISVAAMALAAGAQAAPAGKPGDQAMMDPRGGMTDSRADAGVKARAMFARMDANGDGKLDKADREARQVAQFKKLDTDGNGTVSQSEFLASRAAKQDGPRAGRDRMGPGMAGPGMAGPDGAKMDRKGKDGRMAMMRRSADGNNDGAISRDEFVAGALARFDRADANKDGKVTPDERRTAMKAMRQQFKGARAGMGAGMGDGPPPPLPPAM